MGKKKYTFVLIHFLLIKTSLLSVIAQKRVNKIWQPDNIRVKRQEGYVYDKPSVSFDLPTRPSTVATVVPSSDKTQSQYMFYAYPTPTKGPDDTVNIGFSTTGATTAGTGTLAPATIAAANIGVSSSTSGTVGYNYGAPRPGSPGPQSGLCTSGYNCDSVSSNTGSTQASSSTSGMTGYNYGTSNSVSTGSQSGLCASGYNCNTVSSNTGSTQSSSPTSGITGYNYGTPNPVSTGSESSLCTSGYNCNTISPNSGATQVTGTVSTNAPSYLPPLSTGSGSTSNAGVSVNRPSSPGSTVSSVSIQTGANTVQPIPNNVLTVKPGDSGYLPPSSPSLGTSPGRTSSPPSTPVIPSEYLPPVSLPGAGPTTTVSTPASTYLPPVF
ncbi:unnamed protein product [Diatraea saccharalis]|uniref:Uncharacterized protein n=1 Tax=Diatraea saccharalis TaxID=40085 RepID=A0A9N9WDD5_9NEOP|nr:unnamed protein product [Diatraea saccharalis]